MVASKFSSTAKSNDTISKDWNSASYRQARELLDGGETSFCIVQATATGKSSVLTALMDDYQDEECVLVAPLDTINEQFYEHNVREKI